MSSTLFQLSKLIADSVAIINTSCSARGVELPDLNSPLSPPSEAFRFDPAVVEAIKVATAAAYQLAAVLEPPPISMAHSVGGHFKAASIRVLMETNTVEILREAGPKGLHVDEIAKLNQLDPNKMARLLRFLSTFHMFREVEPDIFANNRISSVLDTGKSGVTAMQPADAILNGYDWRSLSADDLVVDVGAGAGSASLVLARACPDVNIILQDRAAAIEQGQEIWKKELPDAVQSGRVKFQVYDFFTTQPAKNASIFLLKQVLHDWSDLCAANILTQLRAAAAPTTKLIIVESVVAYACHDPNLESIPGAAPREAPSLCFQTMYNGDPTMLFATNSQERTAGHFMTLLQGAGWKVVKIHRSDGTSAFLQQIER
ncbi:hypothetical protein HETIRDRAFT_428361 [Heterobasidion irregulare TC 32-1]|uniref:O-methyltransferase C-terminal domain-containing protein n=1 Tax=Heterobasidion irregulare (strain TC 32-1) TaxID=747525 RepID=W4K2M0_HETIT|nr:uncharacterized protein HETIRDRAFT_428361 [Heterobasidion irregulare TC 32-1]ETW80073.1 hypothetical protein HETIRDRAFT_428361 [Heterobasidion irregulare TC 32-1]